MRSPAGHAMIEYLLVTGLVVALVVAFGANQTQNAANNLMNDVLDQVEYIQTNPNATAGYLFEP